MSNEAFSAWFGRQVLYYGFSGTPVVAGLALAWLYGAQPPLWLVAAETSFMQLVYMPKARDLDPEAL